MIYCQDMVSPQTVDGMGVTGGTWSASQFCVLCGLRRYPYSSTERHLKFLVVWGGEGLTKNRGIMHVQLYWNFLG